MTQFKFNNERAIETKNVFPLILLKLLIKNITQMEQVQQAQLEQRIKYLADLVGVRRFNRILKALDYNKTVYQNIMRYMRLNNDCFEMTKFYERITNKGYNRYSDRAIQYYYLDLLEVINQCKEFGQQNNEKAQ